jgi:Zn-dependent protease with chaperone function
MIKPLFARPAAASRTRSLRRESEPHLFAFVDRVCAAVGAPQPRQIELNCDVNAAAAFRRGALSMFGRDLKLIIGLPLLAGLDARQFAGVLAHEFGHFSQGFGMRLTYLIRSINHWFVRVVYQRDAADEWLKENAESWDLQFSWVLYLAMGFVWLARRVLWVLMYIGHFFASYLLRQMEFNADKYQTRLVGSGAFESTMRQIQLLDVASQAAFADLRNFYRDGRLADDLPRLIVWRAEQLPEEGRKALDKGLAEAKTGAFDTHPAPMDRIVAAKREDADGVYRPEGPASALLADFVAQSKATTLEYYRGLFGNELAKVQLRPVDEIVVRREQAREGDSALERFFQGEWSPAAPVPLGGRCLAPAARPKESLACLKECRDQIKAKAAAIRGASDSLHAALDEAQSAQQLITLLRAEVKVDKQALQKAGGSDGARRTAQAAQQKIERAAALLAPHSKLAAQRLFAALELFYVPEVARRMPEPRPDEDEVGRLFDALQALSDQMQSLTVVGPLYASLGVLVEALQSGARAEGAGLVFKDLMDRACLRLKAVRSSLERTDYPYEHARGQMPLARYLMPDPPIAGDLGSIGACAASLLDVGPPLYRRLLGDLVRVAEAVEGACGLPPIDAPPAPVVAAT